MRSTIPLALAGGIVALLTVGGARAQAVKCSGFLHAPDGSWRSFETATVIGSGGPVRVDAGETFKPTDKREKGDIARILDHVCGS